MMFPCRPLNGIQSLPVTGWDALSGCTSLVSSPSMDDTGLTAIIRSCSIPKLPHSAFLYHFLMVSVAVPLQCPSLQDCSVGSQLDSFVKAHYLLHQGFCCFLSLFRISVICSAHPGQATLSISLLLPKGEDVWVDALSLLAELSVRWSLWLVVFQLLVE